jgi:hypothetical protein
MTCGMEGVFLQIMSRVVATMISKESIWHDITRIVISFMNSWAVLQKGRFKT